MWIRKSMMLSALIVVTSAHGFGSEDLEDFKSLLRERRREQNIWYQSLSPAEREARQQAFQKAFNSYVVFSAIQSTSLMAIVLVDVYERYLSKDKQ